ncbi:hypothetical protein NJHLHPIG_00155 [Klebsiella phage vB_KqM-Bilbo]|nr:hypothetical protein NJHLHPIG_00155 [Klebsiella phage vB_KqM-Bilbo]CAD5240847.1 hypothetical protein KBDEFBCI_00152 [Klebsiella phage vB_KqM-LilBean]
MKYQTLLIIPNLKAEILFHDTIEEAKNVLQNIQDYRPGIGSEMVSATPLNYKLPPDQQNRQVFYLDVGIMSEEDAQNAVLNIKSYIEDRRVCESETAIDLYILNDYVTKNTSEGKE